jgi:hypothetical protein
MNPEDEGNKILQGICIIGVGLWLGVLLKFIEVPEETMWLIAGPVLVAGAIRLGMGIGDA